MGLCGSDDTVWAQAGWFRMVHALREMREMSAHLAS